MNCGIMRFLRFMCTPSSHENQNQPIILRCGTDSCHDSRNQADSALRVTDALRKLGVHCAHPWTGMSDEVDTENGMTCVCGLCGDSVREAALPEGL